MKKATERSTECLIIGNGCAGLTCATMLARSGKDVVVLSRGTTATDMSSGCVAGFTETAPLSAFATECHDVEQARADAEALFLKMTSEGILSYARPDSVLIDLHGMAHRADLAPVWTLQGSNIAAADAISVVSWPNECRLLQAHLALRHPEKKVDRAFLPPGRTARSITFEELEAAVMTTDGDLVVIPPLLPLPNFERNMSMLEGRAGKMVRETYMPLGLPGIRLRQAMQGVAKGAGAKFHDGMVVENVEIAAGSVTGVRVRSGLRTISWGLDALVHCGGGVIGGGLDISGTDAIDPLSTFDIASSEVPTGQHRIAGQGLRVDGSLHLFHHGSRLDNALAAGSVLPGISYPFGAGMGTVMTSAVLAARGVLDGR